MRNMRTITIAGIGRSFRAKLRLGCCRKPVNQLRACYNVKHEDSEKVPALIGPERRVTSANETRGEGWKVQEFWVCGIEARHSPTESGLKRISGTQYLVESGCLAQPSIPMSQNSTLVLVQK